MQLIRLWRRTDYAIVSDEDYEALRRYRWTYCNGYARRWCGGGYLWMQHEVLLLAKRPIPAGYEPDHIDRCGLNNQRENLRIVNRTNNNFNRSYYLRVLEPYVSPLNE